MPLGLYPCATGVSATWCDNEARGHLGNCLSFVVVTCILSEFGSGAWNFILFWTILDFGLFHWIMVSTLFWYIVTTLYPAKELWRSPEAGGAVLALGSAWNAAAAATGELCLGS